MSKHVLLFILVLAIPFYPALSQEEIYVINSFDFNINGSTRAFALVNKAELKEGEEIKGRENLEKFVRDKEQLLVNERVLQKVTADYTIGQMNKDGKYPVDLVFDVEDTWNIIALPYPKYSSNSGLELILKARDYNFFGTMNALRIDLGYTYDEEGYSSLLFEIDSGLPFKALGLNWYFDFDHFFHYRAEKEEPYYYKNITGLSIELPVKTSTLTVGFQESFILNDENSSSRQDEYGEFQKGLFMSSMPYLSWKIPTGIDVSGHGILTYTPEISAEFTHELPKWPLADYREGPELKWAHKLGFSRIDWIGNFRKGFDVYADNSYKYDFYRKRMGYRAISFDYSFSGTGHFVFDDKFGISSRIQFRHWFNSDDPYYDDSAGDVLRGIIDKDVRAQYMLSLNIDVPFKVFQFRPSQWFNYPRFRLIDFDMHVAPILDLAIYHDPVDEVPFDIKNTIYCGGLEFLFFPASMRSLYVRASFAINLSDHINPPPKANGGSNKEIFIGIGHHY